MNRNVTADVRVALLADHFSIELWPGDEPGPTHWSVLANVILTAVLECMSPPKNLHVWI